LLLRTVYRVWWWLCAAGAVAFFQGCASSAVPLADVFAGLAKASLSHNADTLPTLFDPRLRYLRVDVQGRPPALLVLGYLDPHPQGEIEVWYSSVGEVLKTRHGRIVGTAGLELDWRRVVVSPAAPNWAAVAAAGQRYRRWRDEMPGYHQNIVSDVSVAPWPGLPNVALAASLASDRARRYQWFREDDISNGQAALPPAWFAVGSYDGQTSVVYSQQCLSTTFCLSLQRWPPQDAPS
jgi:hypothetical protein